MIASACEEHDQKNAGFTLAEVVMSAGLLALLLGVSSTLIVQLVRINTKLHIRATIATALDSLDNDLYTTMQFQGGLASIRDGTHFQLPVPELKQNIGCNVKALIGNRPLLVLTCASDDGVLVQRILRVDSGLPYPGQVFSGTVQ